MTDATRIPRDASTATKPRRRGRIVLAVVLAIIIALGVCAGLFVRSAFIVKDRAEVAFTLVDELQTQLEAGNYQGMSDKVGQINRACLDMQAEVSSPLWRAATFVPVYGSDVSAVRTLVDALAVLTDQFFDPLFDDLEAVTPEALFGGGTLDLSSVSELVSAIPGYLQTVQNLNDEVQGIGETHVPEVTQMVEKAKQGFGDAAGAIQAVQDALAPLSGLSSAGQQSA